MCNNARLDIESEQQLTDLIQATGQILSTDERDFGAYRWKQQHPFDNLLARDPPAPAPGDMR